MKKEEGPVHKDGSAYIYMEQVITFAELDDYIFCPLSLYYHSIYKDRNDFTYKTTSQTKGTSAHQTVDEKRLTTRKEIIQSLEVYSEKYNLMGKIDTYDNTNKHLIERKYLIKQIYDGYVFQLYAQYFAMIEMGYEVKQISLYSIKDHKCYPQKLPEEDDEMFKKFIETIEKIRNFQIESFVQSNVNKCNHCIYEPICRREDLC